MGDGRCARTLNAEFNSARCVNACGKLPSRRFALGRTPPTAGQGRSQGRRAARRGRTHRRAGRAARSSRRARTSRAGRRPRLAEARRRRLRPRALEVPQQVQLQRPRVLLLGDAVDAGLVERVHHLAVYVDLQLLARRVADSDRRRALVPVAPGHLVLDEAPLAGDAVHDLKVCRIAGYGAEQPAPPLARFLDVVGAWASRRPRVRGASVRCPRCRAAPRSMRPSRSVESTAS